MELRDDSILTVSGDVAELTDPVPAMRMMALALLLLATPAGAADHTGGVNKMVGVYNGDTIRVGLERIRVPSKAGPIDWPFEPERNHQTRDRLFIEMNNLMRIIMPRSNSKLKISALTIAATIGLLLPAYAGGGNMNPAGSDPQPDPHQSGQSSSGTGTASRASSADTKQEKTDQPSSKKGSADQMNEGSATEKKSK